MCKFVGLLILFGVVLFTEAQKLPVQIYYESLCEDSQRFVTQQLYPAYKNGLKDHLDIQWIPFGKSRYTTRGSDIDFECHHGPEECYGNKVHSCAIKNIEVNSYQNIHTKESLTVEYINCLMKAGKNFPDSIYPGKKCAQEIQLFNWPKISECTEGSEGSTLLKANGDLTEQLSPKLTSVPLITFRNKQDNESQRLALTDFTKAACNEISEPKPMVCANRNGADTLKKINISLIVLLFAVSFMN